ARCYPIPYTTLFRSTHQRVGTERGFRFRPAERFQLEIVDVEEAVLERQVGAVGDRLTNAGENLPSEAAVAVVEEHTAVFESANIVEVDARKSGAATDEGARAVLVTEVEQAVEHEAQRAGRSGTVTRSGGQSAAACGQAGNVGEAVHAGPLIRRFGLKAESAEVVAGIDATIVAVVVVDRDRVFRRADINVGVFDDHRTEIGTDVERAVTRESRRCH